MSDDHATALAGPAATPAPAATTGDPGSSTEEGGLRGHLGVVELALSVLAFSAPVVNVAGAIPLIIVFGGVGAPLAIVIAMVVLLLFSVGFTAMARHLRNPGAFYAYVTEGLGKVTGLGASFLAVLAYAVMLLGVFAFLGNSASIFIKSLGGPSLPWWALILPFAVISGVLTYLRLELSAKVLTVAMVLELAIVLVFDVAVGRSPARGPLTAAPLTWHALDSGSGSVGLALLLAALTFIGFEATAVFREEARDPDRTVPRATYLAVGGIGLFYVVVAWALILAYGATHVVASAGADPNNLFAGAVERYVGAWAAEVVRALVLTSGFASMLSIQNVLARYLFSLGTDAVFPRRLGAVHPRHGSPHVSAAVVAVFSLLGIVVMAASRAGVVSLYSSLLGLGGLVLLLLMLLTSVAVLRFFLQRGEAQVRVAVPVLACTALSVVGLGLIIVLAVKNFQLLTGGSATTAVALEVVAAAVFVVGVVLAVVYRRTRPDTYARIGRQVA